MTPASLGPGNLASDARKLAADAQLLEKFLARFFGALGNADAPITDAQRAAISLEMDADAFLFDVVFAMVAHANAAVRRAGLDDVIPCLDPGACQ